MIEEFYEKNCDGIWEHRFGLSIESTDNPGWLATISSLVLDKRDLATIIGNLLEIHEAQVVTDGGLVRVFSAKLEGCLMAVGELLKLAR